MSGEEEKTPPQSIQARIAALNLGHVGQTPGDGVSGPRQNGSGGHVSASPPWLPSRTKTANYPIIKTSGSAAESSVGNQPITEKRNASILPPPGLDRDQSLSTSAGSLSTNSKASPRLPPRRGSSQQSPALPPRRPSEYSTTRRDSVESMSSTISEISALSVRPDVINGSRSSSSRDVGPRIKAPEYDPSSLPSLPARQSQEATSKSRILRNNSTSVVVPTPVNVSESTPSMPSLPPRLPVRGKESNSSQNRRLPPEIPVPVPDHTTFSRGRKSTTQDPPDIPLRPFSAAPEVQSAVEPPPIPLSSRPKPNLSTKPQSSSEASDAAHCLKCRDYSGPDLHAARFPRQSFPNLTISWLANELTQPFPSSTDKARAIFTWLHHNIEYNIRDFLNNSVKPSTPDSTLRSGLAVCEGYAALFAAIAVHAGLQCMVTGGHGKGAGFTTPGPHEAIPRFAGNHAWNAVFLPDTTGTWHLIDSTWGAGSVDLASGQYNQHFNPLWFTMDSEEFAISHYPEKHEHWFLPPSIPPPSWQDYIIGKGAPVMLYSSAQTDNGIAALSIQPALKLIPISPSAPLYKPTTRFMFNLVCPHFIPSKHGKGPSKVFILGIHNQHGRGEDDHVVFDTNGKVWWVDVITAHLGSAGSDLTCFAVDTVDGQDARGMSVEEFRRAQGRKAMSFSGVAGWQLG